MYGCCMYGFFVKQKTAYEMRIRDWSSGVCSSDLHAVDADARESGGLGVAADRIDLAPERGAHRDISGDRGDHPQQPDRDRQAKQIAAADQRKTGGAVISVTDQIGEEIGRAHV